MNTIHLLRLFYNLQAAVSHVIVQIQYENSNFHHLEDHDCEFHRDGNTNLSFDCLNGFYEESDSNYFNYYSMQSERRVLAKLL